MSKATVRAAEKRVIAAAMRLYGTRGGINMPAPNLDCQGKYWYVRDCRNARSFRAACAALRRAKEKANE